MKLTQIRNATLKVEYAGKTFLIDPMLSAKGGFPGFPGTLNSNVANPTVDLPLLVSEILSVSNGAWLRVCWFLRTASRTTFERLLHE